MCNRAVSYSRDVTLTLPHFGVYSKQYMYQDIYVHGTILSLHDIIVVCSYLSWWLLISTVCIFCLYFREKKSISIFETSREATASLESSLQALECRFSRSLIKSRTRVIVAHPWPFKHTSCISILGASYYTTLASSRSGRSNFSYLGSKTKRILLNPRRWKVHFVFNNDNQLGHI